MFQISECESYAICFRYHQGYGSYFLTYNLYQTAKDSDTPAGFFFKT